MPSPKRKRIPSPDLTKPIASTLDKIEQLIIEHNPRAIMVDNVGALRVNAARAAVRLTDHTVSYAGPARREDGSEVEIGHLSAFAIVHGVVLIDARELPSDMSWQEKIAVRLYNMTAKALDYEPEAMKRIRAAYSLTPTTRELIALMRACANALEESGKS